MTEVQVGSIGEYATRQVGQEFAQVLQAAIAHYRGLSGARKLASLNLFSADDATWTAATVADRAQCLRDIQAITVMAAGAAALGKG